MPCLPCSSRRARYFVVILDSMSVCSHQNATTTNMISALARLALEARSCVTATATAAVEGFVNLVNRSPHPLA